MILGGITDHTYGQAVVQTLTYRGFITKMFGQYRTRWTDGDGLVSDGQFRINGLAAGRIENDPGPVTASAQRKNGFLVNIPADTDTQATQNAAIEIENNVRVGCINRPLGEKVREVRIQHACLIGHSL